MQLHTAQELLVTSDPRFLNLNTTDVCCWPVAYCFKFLLRPLRKNKAWV